MVQSEHVMACEWTVLFLAFFLVGLRMAVRLHMKQRHLYVSDGLLVLACVFAGGLVICDTITYHAGYMTIQVSEDAFIGKVHFATNYFFDAGLYLPKLSMVAIYYHIIPLHLIWLRRALYFVAAFTVSAFLLTLFADTFWCGTNVATNWDDGPDACSAFNSMLLMRINWALCFTCECMLFLLPLPVLAGLRSRSKRELAGLTVLLSLGIVTLSVSSGRFAAMMDIGNNIVIYIWATTEFCVSIMVVACTALRPLLRTAWRATRASRSKSPRNSHQFPPPSPPNCTISRRTERKRSSLAAADPYIDTIDDDGGDDRDQGGNDGESVSLVGLTRPQPARTHSRDSGPSGASIGAWELDRDLELGRLTDLREFIPVPETGPGLRNNIL